MTDLAQPYTVTKPKRTRICGPQSKNGCVTCKERRVKCDEGKPGCVRCAESRHVCAGYAKRKSVDMPTQTTPGGECITIIALHPTSLVKPNPTWALQVRSTGTVHEHQCAQLGIQLLISESFSSFGSSGTVLDTLLPQMCHSLRSVHTAAIALGAIHEIQAAYRSGSSVDRAFAVKQYHSALSTMRRDLLTQPDGPIPLILICFMLSVAELFLEQEFNALIHLHGAFRILRHRRDARQANSPAPSDTELSSPEDHLELLLYTIDFQTSSCAMSRMPELATISTPAILPSMTDIRAAHVILIRVVHACWNFTATNYKYMYQPQSASPSIYIQQGQLIAHLTTWLERFNLTLLPALRRDLTSPSDAKVFMHALTLRLTALSTLIYLACILSPYQTAYDAHASRFRQIISDAEAVLAARQKESETSVKGIDGQRFTTGPGLIQPLFFTAYKYRDHRLRRHAIRLLSLAGREGPWYGKREALATTRIMELEENWPNGPDPASRLMSTKMARAAMPCLEARVLAPRDGDGVDYPSPATPLTALMPTSPRGHPSTLASMSTITEQARIHGLGINSVPSDADGQPSNRVTVRLTRTSDIDAVLSYPCGHGMGQQDGSLDVHSQGPCTGNIHWEIWEEILEIPTDDSS